MKRVFGATLALLAGTAISTTALAAGSDTASDGQAVQEIIVSAQRKSQNLQDVPIAVSAITGDRLAASGVNSTLDLPALTPGLSLPLNVGRVTPRIRGVGTTVNGPGLENSIAVYIDDVYISSSSASAFSLSNIDRIEVLKGPQGTLFGRNATGGLIHVVTRDPSASPEASLEVGYDNYETLRSIGYAAAPLSTSVRADLAYYVSSQGKGYGKNLANGQDVNRTKLDLAVRSKWLFELGPDTSLRITGDYSNLKTSDGVSLRPAPGALSSQGPALSSGRPWDADLSVDPRLETTSLGVSAKLNHEFSFAKLTSISAYREAEYNRSFDLDALSVNALTSYFWSKSKQTTQEIHLSSLDGGNLTWIVGGFLFNADETLNPAQTNINPAGPGYNAANRRVTTILAETLNTFSAAGFGQVTLALDSATNLTGGLRYSYELRKLRGGQTAVLVDGSTATIIAPLDRRTTFDKLTWRASIDHHFSDRVMAYASFNTGFKSGGFNSGAPADPAFMPETLNAYEVGLKTELFDRRVRLNVAGFYYDYKNIQVSRRADGLTTVFNGAASEIYGVDIDFDAVITPRLTLSGGIELLHDRFTSFPQALTLIPVACTTTVTIANGYASCLNASGKFVGGNTSGAVDAAGKRLPYTADVAASLTADYRVPVASGEVHASVTYAYNSGYYPDPDNVRRQRPYSNLNASLTWNAPAERWFARIWGRNLTNAAVVQNFANQSFLDAVSYAPPRTFGVTLGAKFK